MKNPPVLYQFNVFALLLCIALVTSCLEMGDPERQPSDQVLGKWYLVRVEEPVKTVAPPTDSTRIWLEFAGAGGSPEQQTGKAYSVRGENLVNLYAGSAIFNGAEKSGQMTIGSLGSTKRGGPALHTAFDAYYLRLLEKASSYTIKDNTLIIRAQNQEMLLFVR
ncbi:META domain-containing protein [Pontibacter qinzhouensis]|uniref:META domain-containing protein n=1 Tax=Pontibacter qinzhouensis TaxID=2603253 RepID=A0A5C8JHI7_9BACT|nr:META domain-containing protein [Pontibacter qinzhouensis]TXK37098.1 META domain-containing protein [Pontibacter qinzhouensis]